MNRAIKTTLALALPLVLAMIFVVSCAEPEVEPVLVAEFPADNEEGLVDSFLVVFDDSVTSDGNGALRVSAVEPLKAKLYELGDVDVEDAVLVYRAKVRTRDVDGHAYVEMLCEFPDDIGHFSRAVENPLYGTTEWTLQETSFDLAPGENPVNVRLNLVINGTGTAWIDAIRVWKAARAEE